MRVWSPSGRILLLVVALLAGLTQPRQAQAWEDSVSLERFSLSPTSGGFVAIRPGSVLPHLRTESSFSMGYADRLLMGRAGDDSSAVFVGNRVGGELSTAIGLWGIAELDLVLPFVAHQESWGNFRPIIDPSRRPLALESSGLGDLKLIPRVQLLSAARHVVDLALSVDVSFPTGGGTSFRGDSSVLWRPSVALTLPIFQHLRLGAQAGALIRSKRHLLGDIDAASELDFGVGAGWRFGPEKMPFELQGSLGGQFGLSDSGRQQHAELRSALAWEPLRGFQVLLGGGAGLLHGYGTPAWRVFSGIRYAFSIPTPAKPAPVEVEVVKKPKAKKPEKPEEPEPAQELAEVEPEPLPAELELTIHFADGSEHVEDESRELISQVASALLKRPELELYVDGHADARGVLELNLGLSMRRARAVMRHLALEGVEHSRMTPRAFGPAKPIADNDTPEGRRMNRRVEFTVKESGENPGQAADDSGGSSQEALSPSDSNADAGAGPGHVGGQAVGASDTAPSDASRSHDAAAEGTEVGEAQDSREGGKSKEGEGEES